MRKTSHIGLLSLSSALVVAAAWPATAWATSSDGGSDGKTQSASAQADASPHKTISGNAKSPANTAQSQTSSTTPAGKPPVNNLYDMFAQGKVDGDIRMLYYANHNAFFLDSVAGDHDRNTASIGGKLGFTSAELDGFSLRLSAFAQRNFARSSDSNDLSETGYNRDLGRDISALGEAYLQWAGYNLRVRAGNQAVDAPFTSSFDYRIIPQVYQGVTVRYGDDEHYLSAMRIYRFKSRISDSYDRTTNYNADAFEAPPPNTTGKTDGFWALGGADAVQAGPADLSGQAWFFNYKEYANMYYVDGKATTAQGSVKPVFGLQYIRETDEGRALLGAVDNHTYGAQLGLTHHSLTATLNYDYIPHRSGTFLNGALVTPYAHNEASGPLFAQPYLTSTQDLGSGNAYAVDVKGAPIDNTFIGARYSYMDLKPTAGSRSIGQSEYLIYGIYNFTGALKGFSVSNFFAYQTQKIQDKDYWENRLALSYDF